MLKLTWQILGIPKPMWSAMLFTIDISFWRESLVKRASKSRCRKASIPFIFLRKMFTKLSLRLMRVSTSSDRWSPEIIGQTVLWASEVIAASELSISSIKPLGFVGEANFSAIGPSMRTRAPTRTRPSSGEKTS